MKYYLDQGGLTTFAQKLTDKLRSIFATKSEIGTPLVAAEAAGMTDTAKIYVYTGSETGYTSGDWYYHDGSAWQDGGIYNSTAFTSDTTLTIPGAAADAKVTGDKIEAVSGALNVTYTDPGIFVKGAISSSDGANTDTDSARLNRFRTEGYLAKNVAAVSVLDGYKYVLLAYSGDTYVGNWNGSRWITTIARWNTSAITLSDVGGALYNYRLVVALENDRRTSEADFTAPVFLSVTDPTLSQSGKAADAKAVGDAIATPYDATATYAVNDVVLYCGGIYVCKTVISTPEIFKASHWNATTIGDVLAALLKAGNVTINATRMTLAGTNEDSEVDSNGETDGEMR